MSQKHPINQSKLYKLYSKSELANILGCSTNFITHFNSDRSFYLNRYEIKKCGRGKREINNPGKDLKVIHRRLLNVFRKIETPEYLKSGIKGLSVVDIAKAHIMSNYMLCLDITKCYQSARIAYVRNMFITDFKMANNLADFLAKLVTIPSEDGKVRYIPTGSPISQMMMFWTYKRAFDDIAAEAKKRKMVFSLYVDDMTFSSRCSIGSSFEQLVIKRLKSVGLTIKEEKTKRYNDTEDKTTVGVKLTTDHNVKITDKNRHKIISFMRGAGRISLWSEKMLRKCRGMIISAQQNEPDFMQTTKRRLDAEIKKLPKKVFRKRRKTVPKKQIKIKKLTKYPAR